MKNGEKNKNAEIVKEMYRNNLPIELIIKITKLSEEEIKDILDEEK